MTEHSNRLGLTGRDDSCGFVKKVFSSSSKKNDTVSRREKELCRLMSGGAKKESTRLQINKMGPNCKIRKQMADVFPELEEEDCDLDKQFEQEICFDQDESMWLSSDCSSPSSFFNKYRFSGIPFFEGPSISHFKEASLALERTILDAERISQEGLEEEQLVTWLLSSTGNDVIDSSVTCSKSAKSSFRLQSDEDYYTGSENSSPIRTHLDSPAPKCDLDRSDFWVSLVNLDGENSKWISDTESELDSFQSDFPSPSFRSSWGSEVGSSNSSVSSLSEINHEKYDLSSEPSDLNSDDPLFWPFERKFDSTSGDFFCMSPRKDINKVGTTVGISPKLIGLGFHDRKMNPKEGCKRKLVFSSASTASKILACKERNSNRGIRKINTTPSRLHKSTKNSVKIVPLGMKDDIIEPTDEIAPKEKSIRIYGNLFEEDFASKVEELPIESLLGLDEFDGHEGVDLDFNKDDFSLDESL